MRRWSAFLRFCVVGVLLAGTLAGCGLGGESAPAPTSTPDGRVDGLLTTVAEQDATLAAGAVADGVQGTRSAEALTQTAATIATDQTQIAANATYGAAEAATSAAGAGAQAATVVALETSQAVLASDVATLEAAATTQAGLALTPTVVSSWAIDPNFVLPGLADAAYRSFDSSDGNIGIDAMVFSFVDEASSDAALELIVQREIDWIVRPGEPDSTQAWDLQAAEVPALGDRAIAQAGVYVESDGRSSLGGLWAIRVGKLVHFYVSFGASTNYMTAMVQTVLSPAHEPSAAGGLRTGGLYDLLPTFTELPTAAWTLAVDRAPRAFGPIPAPGVTVTSTAVAGLGTTFQIDLVDIAFQPMEVTIPANVAVTITLVNKGAAQHGFRVDALGVHATTLNGGESETVTINAEPGEYDFYCPIPGHKEAGMVGTLHVVAAGDLGGKTPVADADSGGVDLPTTVELDAVDIAFEPTELTIPADTDVTITFVNKGAARHNFVIDALDIRSVTLNGGDSTEIRVMAVAAGDYDFYCAIPGHKEAGMVGTLHVVAAGAVAPTAVADGWAGAGATSVDISLVDIAFEPTRLEIAADTDVSIAATNNGAAQHNLSIVGTDYKTANLNGGQSETLVVNLPPGEYQFVCTIPGHKEAGMVGTLVVVAGKGGARVDPTNTPTMMPTSRPTPIAVRTVESGKWGIGVRRAWYESEIRTSDRIRGGTSVGIFLVVEIEIRNVTDRSIDLPWRLFVVRDGKGRAYSVDQRGSGPTWVAQDSVRDFSADAMWSFRMAGPGLKYTLRLVFDVSTDSDNFSLGWTESDDMDTGRYGIDEDMGVPITEILDERPADVQYR